MKKLKLSFLLILLSYSFNLFSQPIYLNIVSHNEENQPDTVWSYYALKRPHIINVINIINSKNAKLNFQSDWKYLRGVLKFDTGSVVLNTNGKNILRWMTEDMGIEADPHAHETHHNYADVAYLHLLNGVTPSLNIGGFLYDTIINGNNWENMQDSIRGRNYPNYWWKPEVLWGSGTPNHLNDILFCGIWKPHSMANFWSHDSTKRLILIGKGCSLPLRDTSNITTIMNGLRNLIRALELNLIIDTGMVTASIFVGQGTFSNSLTAKISALIDSIAPYVASGKIIWSNLTNTKNIWKANYSRKPQRILCSDVPTFVEQINSVLPVNYELKQNYPNPFNPSTNIQFSLPKKELISLKIFDISGRIISDLINSEYNPGTYIVGFNASGLSSGIYFYTLRTESFNETKRMIFVK